MINPLQLLQVINNPQKCIAMLLQDNQVMQNPMMRNALQMYQNHDMQGLNNIANNLCKSNGMTLDEAKKKYNL